MAKKEQKPAENSTETTRGSEYQAAIKKNIEGLRGSSDIIKDTTVILKQFMHSEEFKALKTAIKRVAKYIEEHKEELTAPTEAERLAPFVQMEIEDSEEYRQFDLEDVMELYQSEGEQITVKEIVQLIKRAKNRQADFLKGIKTIEELSPGEGLQQTDEDVFIKFFNNAPFNDLITTRQSEYRKTREGGFSLTAKKNNTSITVNAAGLISEEESQQVIENKLNELQKRASAPTWAFLLASLAELCRCLPTHKSGELLSPNEAAELGTVYINVKDYAKIRNITEDRARQQINDAGLFLFRQEITNDYMKFTKGGKKVREPFRTRIFSTWDPGIGVARAVFAPEIIKYFLNHPQIGYVSTRIFKIDFKKFAHAFYIYYKMSLHHGMNANKSNSNLLSVASLLDATPSLPSYEEAGKRVSQLIRDPFEKNLNYLVQDGFLVDWSYCGENLTALPDPKHSTLKYADWIKLNIDFVIADYPEEKQQIRLEKKAAQIEDQKRKKAVKEELALERREARKKKEKK